MTRIQLRGGTAAQWVTANPVLAAREPGVESDTGKQKIGDGVTPWNSLPYSAGGGGGGATNLGNSRTATAVTVTSSTGTPTVLPAADASNAGVMTAAMQAKLAAAATNAELRDRSTHTGTQPSTSISDFVEAVQDVVGALLAGSSGVTVTYNDVANTLTIAGGGAGGLDAEEVRDTIGAAIIGVGVIGVTVNDAADTITISSSATQNATDAALRDRGTHTGTQTASTISDFAETARDTLAAALVAGANVTITPDDAADTITISAIALLDASTVSNDTTLDIVPVVQCTYVEDTGLTGAVTITATDGQVGWQLWVALTGTASRGTTFASADFEDGAATLPTTTTGTQRLDVGLVWNAATSKWRCMAVSSA